MKKWMAVIVCAAMAAFLLCGCGQQSTESAAEETGASSPTPEATSAESGDSMAQQSNTSLQGMVTAVDGDSITVQTMDRDGNNPGGMKDGGSVPDGRPEDGTAPSGAPEGGDTPSGAPEGGDANGNGAPGGQEMPQGQPDDGAAPAGDEVTITITSDTKISMDENGTETEASADDIAVGCMIGITYGEDGETVTEITIYQAASQAPAQDGAK